MNAEQWARSLDANAFTAHNQWLPPDMAKEIAALLRAGIAASEECERLRGLLERAAGALRIHAHAYATDNAVPVFTVDETRKVLAEIEGVLK